MVNTGSTEALERCHRLTIVCFFDIREHEKKVTVQNLVFKSVSRLTISNTVDRQVVHTDFTD
jgi:hypothetical protein